MFNLPSDFLSNFPFFAIALVFVSFLYWIPAFFLVYHLTRFGIGHRPKFLALVFMVGSVILFSFFIIVISQFDFSGLVLQTGSIRY